MALSQRIIGDLSSVEIAFIMSMRSDKKNKWAMYGKSLEVSLSIGESDYKPCMSKSQSLVLRFMIAIDNYKTKGSLSADLILLIKMKKSKYREALIEYDIWTKEIYLDIYNKYTSQKKL